jgi:hypothetical protein
MPIECGNELSALVQMRIPGKYAYTGLYEYAILRYEYTTSYERNMVSNDKPPWAYYYDC